MSVPEQIPSASERDPGQDWFWAPEWLAGEREADQQLAKDDGEFFASTEDFLASLDR